MAAKGSSASDVRKADVKALLDGLEEDIEALRHAYDKYFSGVDRVAPTKQRSAVERSLRELERLHLTSTALRFRLQGLRARFVTYAHYWTRVLDQMERGIYRRDLLRATRRSAQQSEPSPPQPPTAPPAVDESHIREVFAQLLSAKRAAGESTEGVTYAALVRKISREAPKLRERHGCEQVRFEVATVDGKVRLRARPA